ncbi:MAG: hypothetical protein AAFQ41_00300 [Cyanobacteria bacterium J06623_7]
MIVSTTKYTLKSIPAFVMFALLSFGSIFQARQSRSLIAIKIRWLDLRTLTVWRSQADMKAFRNSGIHQKAMINSPQLGSNQSYTWETDTIPTWAEAIAKINSASQTV